MESPGGLLSLKWNNHTTTFTSVLSNLRNKNTFSDALIACEGKLFYVHKLVLSTCSEYFQNIFENTDCKRPVIVLKDIKTTELDALLNYMYIGEVNVLQTELAGLINAAECLRIKGLAVPDDQPTEGHAHSGQSKKGEHGSAKGNESVSSKRVSSRNNGNSPPSKRLKRSENAKFVPEFKESIDKSKHSSPVQRTSDCKEIRLNNYSNSSNKNQQTADKPGNSSSHEVVLLDNPDPVKSEAVSPKHESEDCYDSSGNVEEETCNSEGIFGSEGGTHHSLDDIMATVGAASQVHHSGSSALHGQQDSREELCYNQQEQQQYESEDGQDNMRELRDLDEYGSSLVSTDPSLHSALFTADDSTVEPVCDPHYSPDNTDTSTEIDANVIRFFTTEVNNKEPNSKGTSMAIKSTYPQTSGEFVCQYCNKSFMFPSHYSRHIRTHTGEKLFACPLCPHRSARKDNLDAHVRCHGVFMCVLCRFCAPTKEALRQHEKTLHVPTSND